MHAIFLEELEKLNKRFIDLGLQVSEQIYLATKSFIDHDRDLAKQVIETDQKINDRQIAIVEESLKLIALQQPVATDFRKIIAISNASTDLERLSDHAESIARETIRVKGEQRIIQIETEIEAMALQVRRMLEQVLEAYLRGDQDLARDIARLDTEVDRRHHQLYNLILGAMKRDAKTVTADTSYLTVIRLLERIGDHIINVAEWVIYRETGKTTELAFKEDSK